MIIAVAVVAAVPALVVKEPADEDHKRIPSADY